MLRSTKKKATTNYSNVSNKKIVATYLFYPHPHKGLIEYILKVK